MLSHVLLVFINAIIVCLLTCGIALYILKKDYAQFLENNKEPNKRKENNKNI
jgi:hypothetical protein